MHGEVSYLFSHDSTGKKIGGSLISGALGKAQRHTKFIAISFPVYEYLVKRFSWSRDNIFYVEHPLNSSKTTRTMINGNVRFGSFGIQSENKNSSDIYKFASALSGRLGHEAIRNVEIVTVGVSDGSFSYNKSELVRHLFQGDKGERLINSENFFSEVCKINFCLMFQNKGGEYELTPSGVFFDCISLGIPIIAMRTGFLTAYFERYGDLGFLCDSVDEMSAIASDISLNKVECSVIMRICKNISGAQSDMSDSNFKEKLFDIVKYE